MADTAPAPVDEFAGFKQVSGASEKPEAPDEFAGFKTHGSTPGEKATAVVQGAIGGVTEASPMVAGLITGATIMGPVPIPGARVVGGLIGAGIGLYAGKEAREGASEINFPGTDTPLTRPTTQDFPADQRPYAISGEVFGGGSSFTAGTVAVAKAGFKVAETFIGSYINRMLGAAKSTPGAFISAEAAGLGGAAVGGATAEKVDPGAPGTRMVAEVAGGFLNPTRILLSASDAAGKIITKAKTALSRGGQETEAGRILTNLIEESGEDPVLLAQLLEANGLAGVGKQTAAQKTGSEALSELQAQLVTINGKFSAEVTDITKSTLDNIDSMISTLRGQGDATLLPDIAKLQALKFKTLLAGRVQAAEREAAEATAKITKDTPAAREEISLVAREALNKSLEVSRRAESSLWDQVSKTVAAQAPDTLSTIQRLQGRLLPEESLPSIISGFAKRQKAIAKKLAKGEELKPGEALTSGELMILRSRALELAREAQAKSEFGNARMYGEVAESVLEDLNVLNAGDEAYDMARAFSKELNDTFTRTFAGHAVAKGARGDRVPPELLLERALGTGGTGGALKLNELEEATRFLSTKGIADAEDAGAVIDAMTGAQEQLVRLAAADAVDAATGQLSAKKLASFIKKNTTLMRRFPQIAKDLEAAVKSQTKLNDVQRSVTNASRVIDQQEVFSRVAKVENGITAVSTAVLGKTPEKGLTSLAKLAKRGGDDAVQGLQASVFDYALREASSLSGRLNYKQLRTVLFDEVNPGQPSIIDIMVKNGTIDDTVVKNLKKLLDEGDKIQSISTKSGRGDEGFLGEADALTDLLTRGVGSVTATAGAKMVGASGAGPSLIIASAGSRFAQRALDRAPRGKVRDIMIEAMKDPTFMAMLLRKPKTPKLRLQLNQQLHAYILQAGLTGASDNIDEREIE